MRPITLRLLAAASLPLVAATGAERPRYGGTLRVGMQAVPDLTRWREEAAAFRIAVEEPGRVVLTANEDHAAGRPFLDAVEISIGKPPRDQALDFELGRADVIDLAIPESRRAAQRGWRVATTPPVELVAIVFGRGRSAVQVESTRQALAASIDRGSIHSVLLQKQGAPSGSLLPDWLSGYGFLFPMARDLARAKQATAGGASTLTFAVPAADALLRLIADRIALNARDAGITLRVVPATDADLRLIRAPVRSTDPAQAALELASALGAAAAIPARSLESAYQIERDALAGGWIVPLFHLPKTVALSGSVRNWKFGPLGEWRLEDVWIAPQGKPAP